MFDLFISLFFLFFLKAVISLNGEGKEGGAHVM